MDPAARTVRLADGGAVPYDTLILATGARHGYFGHDEWEAAAPGLKTIEDATAIRSRILLAFEEAERDADPARLEALLTFVIVGGGPTGVELAGTIADLARDTLPRDFRAIDTRSTRVLLVEAGPKVLNGYPDSLSDYAKRSLEKLGVEVKVERSCHADRARGGDFQRPARRSAHRHLGGGGARVAGRGMAGRAGRPQRTDRRRVDLSVPGRPDIFAVGDTITVQGPNGAPVPGIAPAAKRRGFSSPRRSAGGWRASPSDGRSAIAMKAAWRRSARARR